MVSYIHSENDIKHIYFYDVFIKLWTVTKYDVDGQQVEESDYFNDKTQLKEWYPQYKFLKKGK